MDPQQLEALLKSVAAGGLGVEEALARLRDLPFEDVGFVKIDHHRGLRKGYPEAIFCQGKTPEQVVTIAERMRQHGSNVLGTRCSAEVLDAVRVAMPDAEIHAEARAFGVTVQPPPALDGTIAIVCAGTTDIPVAEEAAVTCAMFGNSVERVYDVGVAGLHRLLARLDVLRRARVLIVCAGMEGALPSVAGGLVAAPVIAVPTSVGYGASFGGIAALLGMLNSCASGVTVVNIDNGYGAAAAATAINLMCQGKAASSCA